MIKPGKLHVRIRLIYFGMPRQSKLCRIKNLQFRLLQVVALLNHWPVVDHLSHP